MKRYVFIIIFITICIISFNKTCYSCDPLAISINQNEYWVVVGSNHAFRLNASVISDGEAIEESWYWDTGGLYEPSEPENTTLNSSIVSYANWAGSYTVTVSANDGYSYDNDTCMVYAIGMYLDFDHAIAEGEDVDITYTIEPPDSSWTPATCSVTVRSSSGGVVATFDDLEEFEDTLHLSGSLLSPGTYYVDLQVTGPGYDRSIRECLSVLSEDDLTAVPGGTFTFTIPGTPTASWWVWFEGSLFASGTGWSFSFVGLMPGEYSVIASYGSTTTSFPPVYVTGIDGEGIEIDTGSGPSVIEPSEPGEPLEISIGPGTPEITIPSTLSEFEFTDEISWSLTGPGVSTGEDEEDGSITLPTLTTPGTYTLTITCGTQTVTIEITVVGVDKIEIEYPTGTWSDVSSSTKTVLKGTKYNFRALPNPSSATWPSGKPVWTVNGSPLGTAGNTSEWVTFGSTGTKIITATCGTSSKSVTINVVEPVVYQVGFGGDHTLYETPATYAGWGDGTTAFTDPVYTPTKNDPVCVTRNSNSISLTNVKLQTTQALTYPTTIKVDASGTEEWNESVNVTFSGTTSAETSLSITGNIINEVKKYAGNFFQNQWKYKVPGGTNTYYPINTTSHTMYVTWGTPSGSSVTEKRIDCVCNAANGIGGTNPTVPADAIFNTLPNTFNLYGTTWGPSPIWRLHNSGEISQCPGIARFVNRHFQMLGLTNTEVIRYCYALSNGTYTSSLTDPGTQWRYIIPGNGHPDPTTHDDYYDQERLAHIDDDGNSNNYEATCYFNGYYYACGIGKFATSKDVVTHSFPSSIEWQYVVGTSPGVPHKCTENPWVEAAP